MTSNELLDKLRHDALALIDIAKEFELLGESTLNWKEHPEKWSILECLEHLNRYSLYYHGELSKAIARAKPSENMHEARSTWMGKKFIAMMHPENKAKHKTFARMNPVHSDLTKETIDRFLVYQKELLLILRDASKIDLNSASISVEFFKLLKMNLGDALQFLVVHEQRHIQQAQAARSNAETLLTPTLKI